MEQAEEKKFEVTVKKLPKSQVEISASIPAVDFDKTRKEALKHLGGDVALPGFRKGHVPDNVLLAKIGESALLEEMAEIAIGHAYAAIIVQEKIDALGRPEVRVTKIAPGNPLEFIITTAVFPEFTLPNYKKLAEKATAKKEVAIVTEDDINKTIEQIQKMRAQGVAEQEGKEFDESMPLPELDDAFAQSLGADFKSVDDLRLKMRENMQKEKDREVKDKMRLSIMDAIVEDTKIELPEIIVTQELARMNDEFAHDVERMGMKLDEYLEKINKTKEDIEKEWRPDAEKRAKIQLIVGKIADTEKLEPDHAIVEKEAALLCERFPDATKERAESYMNMLLTNEKVFEFLEAPQDAQ